MEIVGYLHGKADSAVKSASLRTQGSCSTVLNCVELGVIVF